MSFNNNNKSGSASAAANKDSKKESRPNSPSKFANNPFAPLFAPESAVYNKTSPGPSSVFINKKFVKKAASSHPSGNDSSGPMGQFTTKRAEIVAARKESLPKTPSPTNKNKKPSPPHFRPKRPYHSVSWWEMESQNRLLQANINEMKLQQELTNAALAQMVAKRREMMVQAGIFPLATHAQDKWLATTISRKESKGKRPMTPGEAFLASKEESALEQLKEAANKAEMVAVGLATGWSDEELQAGGWQGTSSEEFAMRANPDSYANKAKEGVSRPGQLFSPTKKSNPYETMTDSQFRKRHDKWSGGEEKERGGWAGPSTQEVSWKVEHTGGHTEAPLRAARQKVAEWRSSSENSDHIIFEVDDNKYKLVKLDQKYRKEGGTRQNIPMHSRLRRYALKGFSQYNKVKPEHLKDLDLHDDFNDEKFELFLRGASSEELETGECMYVKVRGRSGVRLMTHTEAKPIWKEKGLCYLAAIKARTLPLFEWSRNITFKRLVNLTKHFRRNDQFYVTKHGKGQYHLDLQKPTGHVKYAQGDWKLLEFMAEEEPESKIGAKDDETIEKFNGTNWHEWKFRICALLQAKGLWHTISQPTPTQYEQESVTIPAITDKDGKIVKEAIQGFQDTSKVNDDWKEWVTSDIKARGQLSMHMLSSMSIMLKSTAKETWTALMERFDTPGAAGLFAEFQKILVYKFPPGANPATEFNVLAKAFERLNEKGFTIPEPMRVMFFLSALSHKWEGTAQNILFNMDVKSTSIHDILPVISGEWERKQSIQGGVSHGAFAVRANLRTNHGQKPQWKAGAPHPYKEHQNASSGPSGHGQNQQGQWRQANYKKQPFKPRFQPSLSNNRQQAGQPGHPSKGPNWTRNVQNH